MIGAGDIEALVEAVRAAAKAEILPLFRNLDAAQVETKTGVDDLVTVADRAAEVAIAVAVARILPEAAIVGEEAVSADPAVLDRVGEADLAVLVDPIDGTWNFANGIATFGVILAVVRGGETVLGLLYDPVWDDWIMAERGGGAWYARPGQAARRMAMPDQPRDPADAFGFANMFPYPAAERALLAAEMTRFKQCYSLRCACQEYRALTAGRAAFGLYAKLNCWDHAAGVLCVEEAGGVARLLDGRAYAPTLRRGRLLVATTEDMWRQLAPRFALRA